MAHYTLFNAFEENAIPQQVTFVNYRNNVDFLTFIEKQFLNSLERVKKCSEVIEALELEGVIE